MTVGSQMFPFHFLSLYFIWEQNLPSCPWHFISTVSRFLGQFFVLFHVGPRTDSRNIPLFSSISLFILWFVFCVSWNQRSKEKRKKKIRERCICLYCRNWNLMSLSSSWFQFHKDNLRHLSRFPDFFVTFRILSTFGPYSSPSIIRYLLGQRCES